jgi:CheY-like chemotaxis protein
MGGKKGTAMDTHSRLHTLLVEDNRAYARVVQYALGQVRPGDAVHHVSDGGQALDYIFGRGCYADRAQFPLPDLVLLDLRMPRVDGFEVLRQLKLDHCARLITVVVMTSSDMTSDAQRCREYGADLFVTKPVGMDELIERLEGVYAALIAEAPHEPGLSSLSVCARRTATRFGRAGSD